MPPVMNRISRQTLRNCIALGLLVVFFLYYLTLCGIPVSFTEQRNTRYYVFKTPFLGLIEVDLMVIVLCTIIVLLNVSYRFLPTILIPMIGYFIYAYTGLYLSYVVSIILFCFTVFYLCYVGYCKGLSDGFNCFTRCLLRGVLCVFIVLELLVVISCIVYFVYGSWVDVFKWLVLRVRGVWAPLEWFSIVFFILFMWFNAYRVARAVKLVGVFSFRSYSGFIELVVGLRGLFLGIASAWFMVLLVHLPSVNLGFDPVSVDTFYYMRFFNLVDKYGLWTALNMHNMARPAYLIMLYGLWNLFGRNSVLFLDVIHPLVSFTLLVIAVYVVCKRFYGEFVAGLASFLTGIGHCVTTFIAGGFQANSLALPLALLLFIIPYEHLGLLFLNLLILILIHPWTFAMYFPVLLVYYWRVKGLRYKLLFKVFTIGVFAYVLGEVINHLLLSMGPGTAVLNVVVRGFEVGLPSKWFEALSLWTWGSELNAPLLLASSIPNGFEFIDVVLGLSAPLTLLYKPVILHRIVLNIPIEICVARTLAKTDKLVITTVILMILSRSLIILTGLTPLTEPLWKYIPRI